MWRWGWILAIAFLAVCGEAQAQWEMESSGTTADLRGIDNVGGGVAWASGTNGTVLRTEDGGYLWQACAVPPGAEHLDFRGVQAFDANTAIVMSSGKGDLSRLYKTTDGCHTWRLVFTNPDADGFWDAIRFSDRQNGFLLGDAVHGKFVLMGSYDGGEQWIRARGVSLDAAHISSGAFAASNSSLLFSAEENVPSFVTSGPGGAFFYGGLYQYTNDGKSGDDLCRPRAGRRPPPACIVSLLGFQSLEMGLNGNSVSSGGFSIAASCLHCYRAVVVGGDYTKPDAGGGSAAYLDRGFEGWLPAQTTPHGYRSAVAYDAASKTWIAVGPNGTDISTDDGKNWRALHPDPALHEAADADRDWNALSLPFVVGPHGRIGKLNAKALAQDESK
jgi:hypothetical protein